MLSRLLLLQLPPLMRVLLLWNCWLWLWHFGSIFWLLCLTSELKTDDGKRRIGERMDEKDEDEAVIKNLRTTNCTKVLCACLLSKLPQINESQRTINCSKLRQVKPRLDNMDSVQQCGDCPLFLDTNENDDGGHRLGFTLMRSHEVLGANEEATQNVLSLDLSRNLVTNLDIRELQPIWKKLHNLRHLELGFSALRTLSSGFLVGLSRLQTLRLNNGQIGQVDRRAFAGLVSLRHLDLQTNRLMSIHLDSFQNLFNLQVLLLNGNQISHLQSSIFESLSALRTLILTSNLIPHINSNAFVGLSESLEHLDLANNRLTKVPSDALKTLKKIKYLNVGSNKLTQIETGDFVHSSVEEIWINKEPDLVWIEKGAFWDLPNLKSIHLDSNPELIFIHSEAFLSLPSLEKLHLTNNSLSVIQEDMIRKILMHGHHHERSIMHSNRMLKMTLSGNPILCDCNVHYLHQCLQLNNSCNIQLLDSDEIRCTQPESKLLKDLDMNQVNKECPPVLLPLRYSSTRLNNNSAVIQKRIGDHLLAHCPSLGIPRPQITWQLPDGNLLNPSSNNVQKHYHDVDHSQGYHGFGRRVLQDGNLRIFHLKPEDSGIYTCVAENHLGQSRKRLRLLVDTTTNSNHMDSGNTDTDSGHLHLWPLDVQSTSASLAFNWSSQGSSLFPSATTANARPLHKFALVYKSLDNRKNHHGFTHLISFKYFQNVCRIYDLLPDTLYEFCLTSVEIEEEEGGSLDMSGQPYWPHEIKQCTRLQTMPVHINKLDLKYFVCFLSVCAIVILLLSIVGWTLRRTLIQRGHHPCRRKPWRKSVRNRKELLTYENPCHRFDTLTI